MREKSLKRLLSIQSLAIVTIPFAVITAIMVFFSVPQIEANIERRQALLATALAKETESFLSSAVVSVRSFSLMERDSESDPQRQVHAINASLMASPALSALYILDLTGRVTAVGTDYADSERRTDILGSDLSKNPLFIRTQNTRNETWSDTFLSAVGGGLSVAIGIPSKRSVIIGEIELYRLTGFLGSLPAEPGQYMMVVDAKGQIIADNRGTHTARQLNIGNIPIIRDKAAPATAGRFVFEGMEMMGNVALITPTGWRVLVATPVETAFGDLRNALKAIAITLIAVMLIALAASFNLSRYLVSRFNALQKHAGLLAEEVPGLTWPRSNIVEFDRLSEDLDIMAASILSKKQELRRNEYRLRLMVDTLQKEFPTANDLLDHALDQAITLTESRIGYIFLYDENTHKFTLNSWSREVMNECRAIEPHTVYEPENIGLWGEAVRQRRPVIVNDYNTETDGKKGYPEGHIAIRTFMTVPVINNGRIVAVVGLANKDSGYDQSDVLQTSLFTDSVWKILDRIRTEEEKTALQTKLTQAQKMESIGYLAGGIAHDFNNMLSVIIGHVELALFTGNLSPEVREHLCEINGAAQRSADVTRQLLAFARKQIVTPKVLDINTVLESTLKMIRRLIGEDIELIWKPGPSLWRIKIDPSQVDQIIANLTTNARDAILGVGHITISTANETIGPEQAAGHPGMRPGEYVVLTVSDDGTGISPENLGRIFDPFFTTKEVGKGTGLGLATVFGIVKQNGGFIEAESEPGRGTTFRIHLPRSRDESGFRNGASTGHDNNLEGDETLLVVEDEKAGLALLERYLTFLGYRVLAANSPGEAINTAMRTETIDMIVTDIIMPKMNGMQLAREVMALKGREIPCIFVSGYTADVIAERGGFKEDIKLIQKPYSLHHIASEIRRLLDA